ncbi:hypothetical protein CPB86DRAFT_249851 [Serendipita vermifera]|nr:hypothetical protein CPB86DRAFT_249851 [Serendipita vermifera]
MASYYTRPVQPHLEASLPPNELKQEKLTKVTYEGPPRVVGGVGRPDSVHSPTKDLPAAPSSSQQQRQGSQFTPNEKQPLLQSFQQDPNVTPIGALGRNSAIVKCPLCKQCDPTNTRKVIGSSNQLSDALPSLKCATDIGDSIWAAITCLFLGVGFIPYMMNRLKDVEHRCSNCNVHLATWHRSSGIQKMDLD